MPVFGPERVGTDRHHLQADMATLLYAVTRNQLDHARRRRVIILAATQASPVLLPDPYLRSAMGKCRSCIS